MIPHMYTYILDNAVEAEPDIWLAYTRFIINKTPLA